MAKRTAPTVGEAFIKASGLSLEMPLGTAYKDVDLDVAFGDFCAVVANSGEGKTELLLTLAGRMRQTSGTLSVAGWALPRQRARVARVSGMGFFEMVNDVQPVLTVGSVVAAELNLYSRRSGRKAVRAFLEKWGLQDIATKKIESLDRVSYVRLGIALGLVGDPWLLVVDDVESELTRLQSIQLMKELSAIAHDRGVTVVAACTDYELALCADRVVPISDAARRQAEDVKKTHGEIRAHALAWAQKVAVASPEAKTGENSNLKLDSENTGTTQEDSAKSNAIHKVEGINLGSARTAEGRDVPRDNVKEAGDRA